MSVDDVLQLSDRPGITHHNMTVGPSKTESIDTRPTFTDRPRLLASGHLQAPLFERDVLVGISEVIVWQNKASFQHQGGLDHTGDT